VVADLVEPNNKGNDPMTQVLSFAGALAVFAVFVYSGIA
jgi:hypothetical protein